MSTGIRNSKKAFTSELILMHFDPDRPIIVETDASDYVSGCQGIEGIRAKLTKRGLVLRLGLVIWKAVGMRYAAGIYCREYSTSDRDIRGCSYD